MTATEKLFLVALGGLLVAALLRAVCLYHLLEWNLWNEYRLRRRQKEAK